jgi:hypothetical protein
MSAHYIGDFDAQLAPKLTEDGRAREEFPVLSKDHRKYDIRSHRSDLFNALPSSLYIASPTVLPMGLIGVIDR